MSTLIPRARSSHEPAPRQGDVWRLETEQEWVVEGGEGELDDLEQAAPDFSERLGSGMLLLSFRNAVGQFELPHLGRVELVSGKWGEADFDAMLRELTEVAAGLPFSRRIGSGLPYARTLIADTEVPFHAFVYLRYILAPRTAPEDRMDLALQRVLSEPHRRLIATPQVVPIDRASRVGTRGMLRIVEQPWTWQTAGPVADGLASALRGHRPTEVEEDQRETTIDVPENQFVLAVLRLCMQIIRSTEREVLSWTKAAARDRVLAECSAMKLVLDPIRAHRMWAEVGSMTHFPAASTVLQRRYGYRDVLRHFIRLRLVSRIPMEDEAIRDLLGLKDIATLYELWTYFALVRAVEDVLGSPSIADLPEESQGQVSARHGFRVSWADGTEALYNATFRQGKKRASTSVALRPDITLRIPSGLNRGLHLFDAKFKLRKFDLAAEDPESSTFKKADIYKMHAYRDAIPDAASVCILYPGATEKFFAAQGAPPGRYEGVGAIPTAPGDARLARRVENLLVHC